MSGAIKIPLREYELTYLVGTGYTTAEINSLNDEIVTMIGKSGGEISETADWGKKKLAYTIKKDGKLYTEAIYTHLLIKMPGDKLNDFSRGLDLKKPVIRSLLVLKK